MSDWLRSLADNEEQRSKAAEVVAKKRAWLPGSELTPAQLAQVQPDLRRAFYERENQRAA